MRRPFSGEETVTLLSFMSSTSDTRAWYVQEWESMGIRSMFRSIMARTISSRSVSNDIYELKRVVLAKLTRTLESIDTVCIACIAGRG